MTYKNSAAIIRTKSGNTVGCHMIFTHNYKKLNPEKFDYKGYYCKEFEVLETVGGKVVIKAFDKLNFSETEIKIEINFSNVTEIEILTEHDL